MSSGLFSRSTGNDPKLSLEQRREYIAKLKAEREQKFGSSITRNVCDCILHSDDLSFSFNICESFD